MVDTFIYPRTIAIRRAKTVAESTGTGDTIGYAGYSGVEDSPSSDNGYDTLFTGIPASIQAAATGQKRVGELPGNAFSQPTWRIFIPLESLAQYSVRDRDIIEDDEGYRYLVGQAYWDSLGYQLRCIRLES